MSAFPRLLFSDVDGTFLDDRHLPPFSRRTLRRGLASGRVVFVSGRTHAELLQLQALIGAETDVIGENGAFIATRDPRIAELLSSMGAPLSDDAGVHLAALAAPRAVVRARAQEVLRLAGSAAVVADESSPHWFAECSRYDLASARRAQKREFSVLLDGVEYRVAERLRAAGLDVVFSGRWVTVLAGSNKGRAVRTYRAAAERVLGPLHAIAVGDAANDEPMLRSAELAFVIKHPDRGYDPFLRTIPGARLLAQSGARGWAEMIDRLVEEAPCPSIPAGRSPRSQFPSASLT